MGDFSLSQTLKEMGPLSRVAAQRPSMNYTEFQSASKWGMISSGFQSFGPPGRSSPCTSGQCCSHLLHQQISLVLWRWEVCFWCLGLFFNIWSFLLCRYPSHFMINYSTSVPQLISQRIFSLHTTCEARPCHHLCTRTSSSWSKTPIFVLQRWRSTPQTAISTLFSTALTG